MILKAINKKWLFADTWLSCNKLCATLFLSSLEGASCANVSEGIIKTQAVKRYRVLWNVVFGGENWDFWCQDITFNYFITKTKTIFSLTVAAKQCSF